MYTCDICNYKTNARTAIYSHNKTKKHLINMDNANPYHKYEQKIEELEKILLIKENEILKNKEIINEIEELKEILEIKNKEIIKLEIEARIYKELSEKNKNINNNNNITINNLNYVNKHFKNAPPLKKISNYKINRIDMNDDTQIDNIIYYYENKSLYKLIGDHIIKNYKKL